MKSTKNATIIVLAVTAVILLAILIGINTEQSSLAAGASVRNVDYIMATCAIADNKDVLFLIDVPSRKMIVYNANRQVPAKAVEVMTNVDLEREFAAD